MTNLRIFSTFGDAETAWRRFEHIADHYVFQSFNWLSTWHELIGVHRNIRLCLVSVEDSRGSPLMFLPLGIERRWGIRRLVWLGATNADYRAPLLGRAKDQNLSPPEFRAIWDEVTDALPEFDVIHFEFQPELVLDQANPLIGLNVEPGYFDAHYARLPNDWNAFYAEKLGAKSRSTERRKERRLADHGELCLIDAGTREEIHDIVDEMILQKSG